MLAAAASALSLCGVATANAAEGDMIAVDKLMAPAGGYVDHTEGSKSAPVTVIEYASPTCPHCAAFSNDVLPAFRESYVDTGKVLLVTRPFMRNVLDAAVFMLADAAGPENYHNVLSTFFKTQVTWAASEKPRDAILEVAKQLGFTQETFDAALTNQDLFTGLEAVRDQALNEFGKQVLIRQCSIESFLTQWLRLPMPWPLPPMRWHLRLMRWRPLRQQNKLILPSPPGGEGRPFRSQRQRPGAYCRAHVCAELGGNLGFPHLVRWDTFSLKGRMQG